MILQAQFFQTVKVVEKTGRFKPVGFFLGSLRCCWISQAFSTEVEELGDSEASALLISGSLIRVKGWWRKGARDWDFV